MINLNLAEGVKSDLYAFLAHVISYVDFSRDTFAGIDQKLIDEDFAEALRDAPGYDAFAQVMDTVVPGFKDQADATGLKTFINDALCWLSQCHGTVKVPRIGVTYGPLQAMSIWNSFRDHFISANREDVLRCPSCGRLHLRVPRNVLRGTHLISCNCGCNFGP